MKSPRSTLCVALVVLGMSLGASALVEAAPWTLPIEASDDTPKAAANDQSVDEEHNGASLPSFDDYPWLNNAEQNEVQTDGLTTLATLFPTPDGLTRIELADTSFGAWLRDLPVYADADRDVVDYEGNVLFTWSAGVIALDIGDRNLQQCADTAMRLHAEWLWSQDRADEAAYHFTSGDRVAWADYRRGTRYKIEGRDVVEKRTGVKSSSRKAWRRFLTQVFIYAGTRSLRFDTTPAEGALEPGDLLNQGGSPGHVVVILDVAEDADGIRYGLIGQGFMPAQSAHVLRVDGDVWVELPNGDDDSLQIPSWGTPFTRDDAIRFTAR